MSKNSKAYREAAEKIDRDNLYTPLEAAKLAKETSSKKQDSTVEVAVVLGVDPRKADQMVPRPRWPPAPTRWAATT
jgi:large subunit ribosomal protein L1